MSMKIPPPNEMQIVQDIYDLLIPMVSNFHDRGVVRADGGVHSNILPPGKRRGVEVKKYIAMEFL